MSDPQSDPQFEDAPADTPLPADLRFLKILVGTLAGVMIVGLVTIVGLLVTRLGSLAPLPQLPQSIELPDGVSPSAVTFAQDWLVVVGTQGDILLYSRDGGTPVQHIPAR